MHYCYRIQSTSRALTDVETRYAQIEKELLAVVFAFNRFHQYVYGKDVKVESDHKPLESITKKPLSAAPPRLQRMLLQLQRYNFTLLYKPGKEMILADTLSRAYIKGTPDSDLEEDLVCAVSLVMDNLPVLDPKLKAICDATEKDPTMTKLRDTIRRGWPEQRLETPQELRVYWNFQEELSEAQGIILKGDKIVIPVSLQKEMLEKIHSSHIMSMVKCCCFGLEWGRTSRIGYHNVTHVYNVSLRIPRSHSCMKVYPPDPGKQGPPIYSLGTMRTIC